MTWGFPFTLINHICLWSTFISSLSRCGPLSLQIKCHIPFSLLLYLWSLSLSAALFSGEINFLCAENLVLGCPMPVPVLPTNLMGFLPFLLTGLSLPTFITEFRFHFSKSGKIGFYPNKGTFINHTLTFWDEGQSSYKV